MIDVDSKVNYSQTIVLTQKAARFELMSVHPNPVRNESPVLQIDAFEKENIIIVISDFIGRVIQKQTAALQTGLNQITLQHTSELPAGIYNVTAYSSDAKPRSLKLIKQ
jgi:hypothetical protein